MSRSTIRWCSALEACPNNDISILFESNSVCPRPSVTWIFRIIRVGLLIDRLYSEEMPLLPELLLLLPRCAMDLPVFIMPIPSFVYSTWHTRSGSSGGNRFSSAHAVHHILCT